MFFCASLFISSDAVVLSDMMESISHSTDHDHFAQFPRRHFRWLFSISLEDEDFYFVKYTDPQIFSSVRDAHGEVIYLEVR